MSLTKLNRNVFSSTLQNRIDRIFQLKLWALIKLTRSVEAVLHLPQGLRVPQGDAVLLAVVEGGHRAVLGVQLHQELVERTRLLNVGQIAQAEKVRI